jgi:hypothetical protein
MDMENVQRIRLPYLSHFHGQRQRVVRTGKDGVLPDRDLVEVDAAL